MGKDRVRKNQGKAKSDCHKANMASPPHGPGKITTYLVSSPQATNSGASTTTVVHDRDGASLAKNDSLSGIITPESTPTKPSYVPGPEDSPSTDKTLPYPLEAHSPAGATEELQGAAQGGAPVSKEGAGDSVGLKVKEEGDVQSEGTPFRHTMQLRKGARQMLKTLKNTSASRSLNSQLEVEANPKSAGCVRGRGRKKGKSSAKVNSSGKTSSKQRIKDEPVMKTMKDYFPVRRSDRRCKSVVDAERKLELEDAICSVREEGIKVEEILGKGRGVVSTKPFRRGDFVVEYYGDLIDLSAAKDREQEYKADPNVGCYMYYFEHRNKSYCVDATKESDRLGRLLNHSRQGNCCTKLVDIDGRPHLILVAKEDIGVGAELVYDYGDRNKETLQSHPWLAL